MKKKYFRQCIFPALIGLLCFASSAPGLEYQYKFIMPGMTDRQTAGKIYSLVDSIRGVIEVDIDFARKALIFSYDDEYTSEEKIKKQLETEDYEVGKIMLLKEPQEGVMN